MKSFLKLYLVAVVLLAGCNTPAQPIQSPTETATPQETLKISLLYPTQSSIIQMGQSVKTIVLLTDESGRPVQDASVTVAYHDPDGQVLGTVPATFGDGDVYRSAPWAVPHKSKKGRWTIQATAVGPQGKGEGESSFEVSYSTSEDLYYKYGFWLDAPTLRGINPFIGAERGNAENGLIRWGGQLTALHVLPENWVEVQWRKGKFELDSPQAVREFMLGKIGDIGFTPVREIGTFERTKFKRWDAWEAPARGKLYYDEIKWTVFYAPEVDKTYAIATTVVQPPTGIDAHEVLLENFDIDPTIQADGVAPEQLIPLLPQPKLVEPELGARFTGPEQPIVLKWEPVKELAEDEYYQVAIDFDYKETNNLFRYATRETQFTIPVELYEQPNCSVFNWRITLMQQTGVDKDGNPVGKALSYPSLYWYVQWFYPLNEAPFPPQCPNAQF